MSRWHKPDCSAPDIVVDNDTQTPTCLTCNAAPDLDEIICQQAHESPFPAPPPAQPRGKMNLWWPRSVPYLPVEDSADANSTEDRLPAPAAPTSAPKPGHQSPVYPAALQPGEFRLACLTAPPSPNKVAEYPVHVSLEEYPLSNCPAYETVSYCWAGEDGDSTRRHPVFVGPHWDVMLHTRNCWELLRFARPGRVIRLVWVDAVCINQADDQERAAQVAQMGRIYSLCTQVLVYLGPDVAPVLPPGKHPKRARLQDFATENPEHESDVRGVKHLLQRRYFSRLWVVQELILSPRVVVRIGDVDFQSDGATSSHLWESVAEGLDLAPWIRHTSRGAPLDLDLLKVLDLTLSAVSGDPRDRLFAVMGITGISDLSWNLAPEYSIPVPDMFIGFFAHLLINRRMRYLFKVASGLAGPPSTPSWAPDWTSPVSWVKVLARHDFFINRKIRKQPRRLANHQNTDYYHGPNRTTISMYKEHNPSYNVDNMVFVTLPQDYRQVASNSQQSLFDVHPRTGALKAKMVRLLTLRSLPKLVGPVQDVGPVQGVHGINLFEARCGNHNIYFTCALELDVLVEPSNDHLYLFPLEAEIPATGLCILRDVEGSAEGELRLVTTCDDVFFSFSGPKDTCNLGSEAEWDTWSVEPVLQLGGSRFLDRNALRVFEALEEIGRPQPGSPLEVSDLYWTLTEVIAKAQNWWEARPGAAEQVLFPVDVDIKRKEMSSLYLMLLEGSPGEAFDAYLEFVRHQFDTVVDDGRFLFIVECAAMSNRHGKLPKVRTNLPENKWKVVHTKEWQELYAYRPPGTDGVPVQIPLTIGTSIDEASIRKMLVTVRESQIPFMLRAAARRTAGESVEQLLSRKPTEADSRVRIPIGPREERLMDECGCDGSVEYVTIV